jgi:hypothetical protein
MQLPESQKITKKFLRDTMTMAQYETARKAYREQLRAILEKDVPDHEPPPQSVDADAPQAASAPATEGTTGLFVGSSSAPDAEAEAAERDRQRLRAEVASWDRRVKPEEIEHVIQHHPYHKARQLLWQARRQPEPALAS